MGESPAGFGRLLAGLRKARRLTQEQLARKSNFSQSYISQLELSRRRPAHAHQVAVLARALDADEAGTRSLFESAGFLVPASLNRPNHPDASRQDAEEGASQSDILRGILVSELLWLSRQEEGGPHGEIILKDMLSRLRNWKLYEEAWRIAENDPRRARDLCTRIFGEEQTSTLLTRTTHLYSRIKEALQVEMDDEAIARAPSS